MSFFEYIMVIGAILLGIGFAQLMMGVAGIARDRSWDLVHTTWIVALVITHLQFWWGFWDLEKLPAEAWNAGRFVYFVMGPSVLFFCANVLCPHPAPEGLSWREHFDRVRAPFFILLIVLVVWTSGLGLVMQEQPLVHPTRITHGLVIAMALFGLMGTGRRTQAVVAIGFLIIVTANWFVLRWTPGVVTGA